jgi:hypothetical protein
MILTGESQISRTETFPSVNLQTRNLIWTDLGSNPSLRGEMPATNRISPYSKNFYEVQEIFTFDWWFGLSSNFNWYFQY